MLDQLIDKIDKTEIIANMIFISFWVISIIAIVTAMCQFSNKLSFRIISTLCSLMIVALTFFNEKSSDIGYKVLYNKSQEAREQLSFLYLYINSNEAKQVSRDKVVKEIVRINSLLPNVYVPNFIVSLFSFTLVFAENNQDDESFVKEIERAKTKLNQYFDNYPELNNKSNETGKELEHQNQKKGCRLIEYRQKPLWIDNPPHNDSHLYGIGVAPAQLPKSNQIQAAKILAMNDISFKIRSIINSQVNFSVVGDEEDISKESQVAIISKSLLQNVKIIDQWNDVENCVVYILASVEILP